MAEHRGDEIGVGVIGLGFMGGTHIRAYHAAAEAGFPCRLVAVCDSSAELITGKITEIGNIASARGLLFDSSQVRGHLDVDEFLADANIHLVSICTYTDSHVDLAIRALKAGKHVLVEKPVAASSIDVRRLADVAKSSNRLCMPAMCMRFWPGWDWLRDRITDHSFGSVRSATFQRLGSQPAWAREFYGDISRSGGALLDLHIHDADFIHWCFGARMPQSVMTNGSLQHLTTQYRFADGPEHVTAEAAWDLHSGAGFRMRYLVNFERATADFDLGRTPTLMLHQAGDSSPVEVPALTGYDGEVRHLLSVIAGREDRLRVTLDDAAAVMRMLESERRSLETGTLVKVNS